LEGAVNYDPLAVVIWCMVAGWCLLLAVLTVWTLV